MVSALRSTSHRTKRCGQRGSASKVRPSRLTLPVSEVRRLRMTTPGGGALAVRAEIAPGTLVEGGERIMVEASPNLGLPAAVEVFDGGLEPAFPRRREHGRDVEAQAGPHHATNRISMLMRPLEDRAVVEL